MTNGNHPTYPKSVKLIMVKSEINSLIPELKDSDRAGVLEVLNAFPNDIAVLEELLQETRTLAVQSRGPTPLSEQTHFEDEKTARAHIETQLIPRILDYVRLIKFENKDDQFAIIFDGWLTNGTNTLIYTRPNDVMRRLTAVGIPMTVFYSTYDNDGNAKQAKPINVFEEWHCSPLTQSLRLSNIDTVPGLPIVHGEILNTWRDVSVEPVEGVNVSILTDHIHNNLCMGNREHSEYILNYLAHMVQFPAVLPKVGIAMTEPFGGSGKNILVDFISRMLGGTRNANLSLSDSDTDRFTSNIGGKLLLVFNECTFSGNHKQRDFMKTLITESTIRSEGKGTNARQVRNFARTFIISNRVDHAVPAELGDRRWLIIHPRNRIETKELAALADAIGNNEQVGRQGIPNFVNGFKHFLLTRDISRFNPQLLPEQTTGAQNKIKNLYQDQPMSVRAFVADWLSSEGLKMYRSNDFRSSDGETVHSESALEWSAKHPFSEVFAMYDARCKENIAKSIHRNLFGKLLSDLGMEVVTGTGNVRFIKFPHPLTVLTELRRDTKQDKVVDATQEEFIKDWTFAPDLKSKRVEPADLQQQISKVVNLRN